MNNQELFDKIVNHLRTQNKRAFEKYRGVCAYRAYGLKCAAGILIPDRCYSSELEGRLPKDVAIFISEKFNTEEQEISEAVWSLSHSLSRKMQYIHDTVNVENWEIHFENTAADWGLEYKELL